jgi:uncharacterized protein YjbI with pentapeptide repeats
MSRMPSSHFADGRAESAREERPIRHHSLRARGEHVPRSTRLGPAHFLLTGEHDMSQPTMILTPAEKKLLVRSRFGPTDLSGVDFSDADLRHARFDGACLIGADFSRADLRGAEFHGCDLRAASFVGTLWGENVLHESLFARARGFTRELALYIQICGGTFFSIDDVSPRDR